MNLEIILTILSYLVLALAIILTLFIYISFLFSDRIIKWRVSKIKEERREVIKIALQDLSLFSQLSVGIGIALLLYSLSSEGVQVMTWGLMGIVAITTGIFLIFWRYLPLRDKIYNDYNKKKK